MIILSYRFFGILREQKVAISHPSSADVTHWVVLYKPKPQSFS